MVLHGWLARKRIHISEPLGQQLARRSLAGEVYASKEENWALPKLLVLLYLSNIKCLEKNPGKLLSQEEGVN